MSLESLERALPALAELRPKDEQQRVPRPGRTPREPAAALRPVDPDRRGAPATDRADGVDWAYITRALGTPLPRDYQDLVERYQGLVINDRLGVRMPRPGLEQWYVDGVREHLLELEDAWRTGDSGGHVPYPRPRGLIPWGGSIDGDTFYWRTHPDGPEAWTVVVCGACDDWQETDRDLTGYLAGLVLGEVEPCGGLPVTAPGTPPSILVDGGRRRWPGC